MKTTWVEILVISAIVPILALRIIYGRQWLAWEYRLIESYGINLFVYDMIKTAVLVSIGAYYLMRSRRK
jgi:hypothetical protein